MQSRKDAFQKPSTKKLLYVEEKTLIVSDVIMELYVLQSLVLAVIDLRLMTTLYSCFNLYAP